MIDSLAACALGVSLTLAPIPALSLSVLYGADGPSQTAKSEAAFADWSAAVGTFAVDNLDVLAGSQLTSGEGAVFTGGTSLFSGFRNPAPGVPATTHLTAFLTGGRSVTRTPALPVTALGLFGFDPDGADVRFSFDDGSVKSFTRAAVAGSQGSLFLGVAGLATPVSSVDVFAASTVTDWDRFAYAPAPLPAAAVLPLGGPGALGLVKPRRA